MTSSFWDEVMAWFHTRYEVAAYYEGRQLDGGHTFTFRSQRKAEQKATELTRLHKNMFGRSDVEYRAKEITRLGEVEDLPTCAWCGKDTSMTCTTSELPVPECKNFH